MTHLYSGFLLRPKDAVIGFFFFNYTATTEIYSLSLHDALPISITPPRLPSCGPSPRPPRSCPACRRRSRARSRRPWRRRSEEHTSELQSQSNIVCRLLLEQNTLCSIIRN